MRIRSILTCLAGIAVLASPATADVTFQIETVDHEQKPPAIDMTRVAIEGRFLYMEMPSDEGDKNTLIFRPDRGANGTLYLREGEGRVFAVDGESGAPSIQSRVPEASKRMGRGALRDLMKKAGVDDKLPDEITDRIGSLSAGQRVRTARTIVHNPELILADEPFADGFDVLNEEGARDFVVWALDPSNFTGGKQVAAAFQAVDNFLKLPAVPANIGEDLFVFDLAAYGGLLPIGIDEYAPNGTMLVRSRFRNAREEDVHPSEFAVRAGDE